TSRAMRGLSLSKIAAMMPLSARARRSSAGGSATSIKISPSRSSIAYVRTGSRPTSASPVARSNFQLCQLQVSTHPGPIVPSLSGIALVGATIADGEQSALLGDDEYLLALVPDQLAPTGAKFAAP